MRRKFQTSIGSPRGAPAVCLALLLLALAGCSGGDRTGDSDNQRPVFYGGVTGSPAGR